MFRVSIRTVILCTLAAAAMLLGFENVGAQQTPPMQRPMPKNMPMGKTTPQKKKPTTKAKSTKNAAGKKTSHAMVPGKKKPSANKTHSMSMPMGKNAPSHAMMKSGAMRRGDSAHAMPSDSGSGKMGGMAMKHPPAKPGDTSMMNMNMPHAAADSMHMNMPAMQPHSPDAASKGMPPGMNMPGMSGHSADDMMIGPAGVSMERMGSGTTWIPDAVTLPNRRRMLGSWMIMAHGFAFLQYDHQNGERGESQFGSLNWLMLMATHDLAGGRFQARTMLSLDPLTVTNRGYPLLLQTGESYNGQPLHDRQHPHDFWMELGALYQRPLTKSLAWSVYAAPSGEPALSPVAFMHRPSAMDNPSAPIGHHWQDATHVSFGVLTGGIFTHQWQVEGSIFNGREPDQNRWDFDPIKLDSYSGRVTLNPARNWSLAGGYGYLKSPEALKPDESMHRVTASVQHGTSLGQDGQVATTLIWAANKHSTMPMLSHSVLLETEAILDKSNTLFGRSELVQKSAEELVVDSPVTTRGGLVLPGFPATKHFNVATAQLGYIREIARTHWATIGLGASGTLNFVPSALEPYYGSRTPVGTFIFLRLRPYKASNDVGGMKMEPPHE